MVVAKHELRYGHNILEKCSVSGAFRFSQFGNKDNEPEVSRVMMHQSERESYIVYSVSLKPLKCLVKLIGVALLFKCVMCTHDIMEGIHCD